jgi:cysteine desulfurase
MLDHLGRSEPWGDPSRSHLEGLNARVALEDSRDAIAQALGVRSRQLIFCSNATEAIAAACHGALMRDPVRNHSVLGAIEHSAVTRWAGRGPHDLARVDSSAVVQTDSIKECLRPDTAIVHLQWANHEVGTRQPVAEAVEICADHPALLHVDAAQAVSEVVEAVNCGADCVSISGHKLGGPNLGMLVVRSGLRLAPLMVGGDQERARRAGMEDVLASVGLAAAVEDLVANAASESGNARRLTDEMVRWAGTRSDVTVVSAENRAPHITCFTLAGVEPQPVLMGLDSAGIAAHSGSACSSEVGEPSPVLEAMGVDAHHSLRLSVGWNTTEEDIARALPTLGRILDDLSTLGQP